MDVTLSELRIDATTVVNTSGAAIKVEVYYFPVTTSVDVSERFRDHFFIEQSDQPEIWRRLETLIIVLQNSLPIERLGFGSNTVSFRGRITKVRLMDDNIPVQLDVNVRNRIDTLPLKEEFFTGEQYRLVESTKSSIRRLAWEHLSQSLNPTAGAARDRVFISYRKGHDKFAEAIAHRLGQEGLKPWLDAWDIAAGDSLVGKLDEALETSFAFVPVLSSDYAAGKWASAELEAALVKRINTGFRLVPILYDPDLTIPPLLNGTVWADCTNHSPEAFENQMRMLIDGIYGLARNPYL